MGKFIFTQTEIPGVVVIEPQVFGDDRGYFMETYQKDQFAEAGIDKEFVQDNQSRSTRGVLRGLHFQKNHTQGKLVRVTRGEVFDVAVDCTGAEPAIRQAMKAVKKTGTFIQIGLTKPELTIDYSLLTAKELQIVGTFGHQYHNWEMAIELMASGKVQVDHLITSRYDLEDWQRGFEEMQDSKGIKILLYPNGKQGVEP